MLCAMNPSEVKLTRQEKLKLKDIKKHGSPYNDETKDILKYFASLSLIELCFNENYQRYIGEFGETENAYRISDFGNQVLLHNKSRFWIELRAWITLVIAIIALVISVIALKNDMQEAGAVESRLQPETQQSQSIE